MKALSLQQPYAELIVAQADPDDPHRCLKPVENRSWPLPSTLKLPARIYVHASQTLYPVDLYDVKQLMLPGQWLRMGVRLDTIYSLAEDYKHDAAFRYKHDPAYRQRTGYFGCIIGEVTITGCVLKFEDGTIGYEGSFRPPPGEGHESPWFFGPFAYTLEDPVRYDKPIPMKGHLGFWEVNLEAPAH